MRRHLGDRDGSIPLVLIVVIIVGGVVIALFGVVRTGTSMVGRDRDFAAAIHIADAGLQDAYLSLLALNEEQLDNSMTDPCLRPEDLGGSNSPSEGVCTSVSEDFEDGAFVYQYTRVGDTRNWQVLSWGAYRDGERLVRANVGITPLFTTAMLAREDLTFNGFGNSTQGSNCSIPPFSVGSGGVVKFTGHTASCVSSVTIFNEPLGETVSGSDFGTFDVNCDPLTDEECSISYSLPSGLDLVTENTAAIEFDSGDCAGSSTSDFSDFVDETGTIVLIRGDTYCINNDRLSLGKDEPIVVHGDAGVARVVVRGVLHFDTQASVNVGEPAGNLLFEVGGDEVIIQGTAEVSAGVYAPAANCDSNGGSGSFAGAMTCEVITINGTWRYDASVMDIEGSAFGIRNWAEIPPGEGPPVEIDLG